VKDPVKRMRRLVTDCVKIFPNHICEAGLVSRMCKEMSEFNSKKTNDTMREWTERRSDEGGSHGLCTLALRT
jgi:hypothetical protein